ncbi:MAG: hypothetical protein Q4F26_05865 [Atopococcus tabaci]|uniref:Uncharacterized protein n=1 Tax=Atopococcus tabaci TaxID=269774 RepID=A0AA43UDD2_9LACT|nr:hypothetical protein [Atopococcus tabaci]
MNLCNIELQLLYKVLSIPSYSEKEIRMREFLIEYARQKEYDYYIDEIGNVYMRKGFLSDEEYYPCITAHMDTVQTAHIALIEQNQYITLITEKRKDNKHIIYAEDLGLGGDDKAGIVIALSIMDKISTCKCVFFVEEEIGCRGSENVDLSWFGDVGYIMSFDSPESNCASWSCCGKLLFDRCFYETYLEELSSKFGLTKYVAHPYTDVMMLRMNTCLVCMNFGAGYYNFHTLWEYVVAEEMDNAVAMGIYLIERLDYKEYFLPYSPRSKSNEIDEEFEWFQETFK